jgi:hypothetical protein
MDCFSGCLLLVSAHVALLIFRLPLTLARSLLLATFVLHGNSLCCNSCIGRLCAELPHGELPVDDTFGSDRNCPARECDELVDVPNNSISVLLPKDLFVVAEEAIRRCHVSRDSASGAEFME